MAEDEESMSKSAPPAETRVLREEPVGTGVLPESALPSFSSTKREILLILKREGEADLRKLAGALSISRMAVYRHVKELEAKGLIVREVRRTGVGRPKMLLKLAPASLDMFPKAYAEFTCAALDFIEEKLGRKAVEEALRRRQKSVAEAYRVATQGKPFGEKVAALADLREKDGYMAELHKSGKGGFELLEHNCPVLAIAEKYWEACKVETELFRNVLDADVEATHRVVAGSHVCRFMIKPRVRRS
ncbi:MAG TPA: metalloregulator ArsR/SmtB family transcription factor [Thermoplasmata archaeon]|nr:metalloregulator ArsR/SmtB family transcription factor [Thermoplasmata archaeon]